MAKKIKTVVKVQIKAAVANPAPPVGTALGPHGINIGEFCQRFNEATKAMAGDTIPTEITIYEDRTYSFILKTPPTSEMIKKSIGLAKGSAKPLQQKVGKITRAQIKAIAEKKMPDLNANDIEGAMKIVEGTARQMGVTVEG